MPMPTPNLGERVSIDSHGTIFSIIRVSENNVDLQLAILKSI